MQSLGKELLVDVAVLDEKASMAETKIKAFCDRIGELEQKMSDMRNYWQGEAADGFQEDFQDKKEMLYEVLGRFQEEIQDLRSIAGIYRDTESHAVQISDDLPTDIIQ
ncbi:MAG: WXG100 family type VII secretion target [Lachnospiraceae bacterium]|nr:WXG100 family type VII secretion target [Lachnospiraceae bacterium]